MCGIVGGFGHDCESWVRAAVPRVAHRGPDSQGVVTLGACALGMARLAVLDPDPRADQPMTRRGSTLVFNGEIYNFRELRAELQELGHVFTTSGDTEVVLVSLLQWGLDALPRLAGMFAFAWWAESSQTLTLCRDAWGIKPLYWRATGEAVSFASESRVLASADRPISQAALMDFLAFGSPVGSVVHEQVRELPPGCVLQICADGVQQHRWVPSTVPVDSPPVKALAAAVRSHLVSDRPVALFLSGGFDSALIAAHIAGAGEQKPLAITLRTAENTVDVERARRTARRYGLDHHVHDVELDLLPEMVLNYVAAQDQPTLDGFNTYLVSQAARAAGCVVALSGLGGDEVLGGYSYYRRTSGQRLTSALPLRMGAVAAPSLARLLRRPPSTVAAQFGTPGAVARFLAARQVFSAREVGALTGRPPQSQLGLRDDPSLPDREQLSRLDFEVYLRATLLRDADIFSMHHGLELRVPLLDSAFVHSVRLGGRTHTKDQLAAAVDDRYLSLVAAEPKLTFSLPWERWIGAVQPALTGLLKRGQPWRGHLNPPVALPLAQAVDPGQNWLRPWALVVLALWMEHNDVAAA